MTLNVVDAISAYQRGGFLQSVQSTETMVRVVFFNFFPGRATRIISSLEESSPALLAPGQTLLLS